MAGDGRGGWRSGPTVAVWQSATTWSRTPISIYTVLQAIGYLDDTTAKVLSEWVDLVNSLNRTPMTIVYIRTHPKICLKLLPRRARNEESNLSLEYRCELHEGMEKWLVQQYKGQLIVIDGNRPFAAVYKDNHSTTPFTVTKSSK